jgi:hypothetical protein
VGSMMSLMTDHEGKHPEVPQPGVGGRTRWTLKAGASRRPCAGFRHPRRTFHVLVVPQRDGCAIFTALI